jgi:transposase InsO family protein
VCLVCQACEPPSFALKNEIHLTPVPDKNFASVCLDVFAMPNTEWLGQPFDCYLLCVDRLTGWMVAQPTTKQGLTGERAAHLLLDASWGEFGVPSVVTCDQGPQFVSQWFVTWCARQGIRLAYSQAHRPQANGRAEVCGRVLQLALRKMHCTEGINWVEALPRALRFQHDTVGEFGVSPYELVFGRERNLAGIPWQPVRECAEVGDFLSRVEAVDKKVAEAMNEAHQKVQSRVNTKRKPKAPFEDGSCVWLLYPKRWAEGKSRDGGGVYFRFYNGWGKQFIKFAQTKACCMMCIGINSSRVCGTRSWVSHIPSYSERRILRTNAQ